MSECVVRMKMPENNCEMAVEIKGAGDWCPISARVCDYYSTKKMPDWCPIICQLPEGHGRLVDIDRKFLRVATDGHGISLNWNGSIADMIDADNMRGVEIIVPATETEATPCP